MKDYLKLDNYLIPRIVPVIYRIGLIFFIIKGLYEIFPYSLFIGIQQYWMDALLSGLFWIVIMPVILRIICELLLILYDINQTLIGIRSNLTPQDDKQNKIEKET